MTANNLDTETDARKVVILLNSVGQEALPIFNSFNVDMSKIKYNDLLKKFETHFMPKVNISMERHRLFNRKQRSDEDIESYATDLKNISLQCDIQDCPSLLTDIFSWNLASDYIKERILIEKPKTFDEAVNLAKTIRNTKIHTQVLSQQAKQDVHAVHSRRSPARGNRSTQSHRPSSRSRASSQGRSSTPGSRSSALCPKCGQVHRVRCPAMGVTCRNCGKKNHFASVCRYQKINQVDVEDNCNNNNTFQCDNLYLGSLFLSSVTTQSQNNPYLVNININKTGTLFLLDTGADTNILSFKTYKHLKLPLSNITKSSHKLSTFSGEILPTVGQCNLQLSHDNKTFDVHFHIVDLPCQNILGRRTCEDLKLVKRVHKVQFNNNIDIFQEYSDIFEGIGCLKDFECKLTLKPDAVPSVDACRRVPFCLLDDLKKELQLLEENNIISKVEEPTDWVSSIVITSKKNGKLRLCIDPRKLNQAIMRAYYQFPTIDEIKNSLCGAQYFSTLDANKGFYMLKLDESSSKLCTFITPQGRYRSLRLPFGINSAPEIFHSEMSKRFHDIQGVKVMMDDLLIFGRTKEEHDSRLLKVLNRAREIGIKFNKDKSYICQNKVKYLGHIFSREGVQVDQAKVKAICDMPPPSNVTELQRFLGMVTYLGQYIDNLSQKTSHLRSLLLKNSEWHWSDQHSLEFNNLKNIITNAPILTYFDQNKDILLSVDSSQNAMGAVISHGKQPIAYASASLSQSQQAYSQIEKELLAILFGCTKFHQYIYGRQVVVETDHKPIIPLFKKPVYSIPARLQRIMMRLQPYDLKVVYKPGKYLYVADTLSRCALPEQSLTDLDADIDLHVNLVMKSLSMSQSKLKEFQNQTATDPELATIINLCKNGWPERKKSLPDNIRPYFPIKNELHVLNGLVLKNNSIVVPISMRNDTLKLLHEGHQGVKSCQNLARNSVYWPNMYSNIQTFIDACHICLTYRRNNTKETLKPHEIKPIPWYKVGVDIFELNSRKYLLVVDYYTKYVELALLSNSTATSVINHLKSIFSRHGIPKILQSDNGTPFNSKEISTFMSEWQIDHTTSSPYHSRSNGMVERAIGTVENISKKCQVDGTSKATSK